MKTQGILVVVVILLSTAGLVQAQEGQITGTLDVTYMSRYIWRGFDIYPDAHSAIQPSISLNLWDTGFGAKVFMSMANGGHNNGTLGVPGADDEWLDYTLFYGGSLYEGESSQIDYTVGWTYYNFPKHSRKYMDMQEIFAAVSWPEICPAGVVPSYTVVALWPSCSSSTLNGIVNVGGWLHIFGLGYGWTVPGLTAGTPEQVINLSAAAVYNDGVLGVDSDWSHTVFGASTSFDLGNDLTFTPGVYYQSSWEDSVNTSDEYWTSLSVSYAF